MQHFLTLESYFWFSGHFYVAQVCCSQQRPNHTSIKKHPLLFSKIVFIIDVHVSFSSVLRYTNGFMNPWYLNDIVKTNKSFTTAKYLVIRWKHHNIRSFQIPSRPNYVLKKYFFKCSHCCKSRPISFVPAFLQWVYDAQRQNLTFCVATQRFMSKLWARWCIRLPCWAELG